MRLFLNTISVILVCFLLNVLSEDVCYSKLTGYEREKHYSFRYLFYDVNPPEGFNLRRDVYMRFAILARYLSYSRNPQLNRFQLVLPPFSHLVHWNFSANPEQLPWSTFFDVESLKRFVPVIEMYEFFNSVQRRYVKVNIDEVYILQHFPDMFETGNFKDRMKIEHCQNDHYPLFFYYDNITSNSIQCLSYHGSVIQISRLLDVSNKQAILIDHAEVALHDQFGSDIYWKARRSMRFNKELRALAASYRSSFLNSNDIDDNTILPENWKDELPKRDAKGGPYLAVHLRRKDFLIGRAKDLPNLNSAGKQIVALLNKLDLKTVFVATDAPENEFQMLKRIIGDHFNTLRYYPTKEVRDKYRDGGVAIIDQIICSYGRHFVGTAESTFSFRIQEEREILGFPINSTFNSFCVNETECRQPTVWKIVY